MIHIFYLLILFIASCLLLILAIIDARTRLLPNVYVLPFASLALIFHAISGFSILSLENILLGGLCGGGLLYGVRTLANRYYGTDTLGLGDVKLMAAAGLWLGVDYIFMALAVGALAGVIHGLMLIILEWQKTGKKPNMQTFAVPAGPGFIIGIFIVGFALFQDLPHTLHLQ